MKLFVSALEYSANVHLRYLLRELVKRENVELCGIFDEKIVGNLSLGMRFRTCENFGERADSSLVLSPKFSQIQKPHRKYFDCDSLRKSTTNQTKNTESSLDSADSQNLAKKESCEAPENSPASWCKKSGEASSSANADFLLEAEKRGTLPKSEKRQLLGTHFKKVGESGVGGAALLRKESSEISAENSERIAESSLDSVILQNLGENQIRGKSICNIENIAVMGFIDVLKKAKFFLDLRKKCLNLALSADKILLMDSSSFNIPLAKRIKKRDKTKQIIYYILPQVWAWKPWRAKAIEANCDRLAAILPFEVGFYREKAEFVGHPLLDEIQQFRGGNSVLGMQFRTCGNFQASTDSSLVESPKISTNTKATPQSLPLRFCESQNLVKNNSCVSTPENSPASWCKKSESKGAVVPPADFLLEAEKRGSPPKSEKRQLLGTHLNNSWGERGGGAALLRKEKNNKENAESSNIFSFMPGSRMSEIKRIFPIFAEVKDALKARDKDAKFHLIIPQKFASQNLHQIYGDLRNFHISFDAHRSLFQSRFAFICSGTATLECALIGTPFVLGYKCRALEAFIARCFLKVKFIGLANILYEKISPNEIFHAELIQGDLTAQNLLGALDSANENEFLQKSLALRKYLKYGSASAVAKMLYGL